MQPTECKNVNFYFTAGSTGVAKNTAEIGHDFGGYIAYPLDLTPTNNSGSASAFISDPPVIQVATIGKTLNTGTFNNTTG